MRTPIALALVTAAALTTPALAQQLAPQAPRDGNGAASPNDTSSTAAAKPAKVSNLPPITLQHVRPNDRRGVNVFETPKVDATPFTGFRLDFGAAFTQQFQGLGQSNTAAPNVVNGANANQLVTLGHG